MKLVKHSLSLIAAGLFSVSAANAATVINSGLFNFDETTSQTMTVRMTSWNDPNFGEMGWTHHSGWGKFTTVNAGDVVTIKAVSTSTTRFKPAITVWYRGADDTAPDEFVPDHFYVQNANMYVKGAKNEVDGATLGDISMKVVAFGFDKDSNKRSFLGRGKRDGVPGQLSLTFVAKRAGTYMFVVGGFSPAHSSLDAATRYPVETTVTIATPEAKPAK
jgi:hypothetical protein